MHATKYVVYLADESMVEHHGKAKLKEYQLCFMCAVKMVIKDHVVNSEVINLLEEWVVCDRCSGNIPENAK